MSGVKLKPSDEVALVFLVILFFGVGGFYLSLAGAYFLACGTFKHGVGIEGVISVLVALGDTTVLGGQVCAPDTVLVRGLYVTYFCAVIVLCIFGYFTWRRWMESDKKLIKDLVRREGIAQRPEVVQKVGDKALASKAKSIRPTVKNPALEDVGKCLGVSQGARVWLSAQDTLLLFGPPRSGKGVGFVISEILDTPGAVITTSTRGDNAAATWKARSAGGRPVVVFDPQGITGVRSKIRWSPYRGCASADTAAERAKAIIGASAMGSGSNNQEWAEAATTILTYLLHAAALGQVHISVFTSWCQSPALARGAVEVLTSAPDAAPGWAQNLEAEVVSDPRVVTSKWMAIKNATSGLIVGKIAELFDVSGDAVSLDPEEFITQRGTLYLIGTRSGGGAVGPLLIGLLDDMYSAASRLANRSPGSRLEPPMRLVLDEIGNFSVWNRLPEVMTSGGGIGVGASLYLQSSSQAKERWGAEGGAIIVDSANYVIQLGNSKEIDKLQSFVNLVGEYEKRKESTSYSLQGGISRSSDTLYRNIISASELSRLPMGYSFVLPNAGRPLIMKSEPYFKRADKDMTKASQDEFVKIQKAGGFLEVG
ncbi:hypothetical protein E4U03_07535 [Rothia nasimurium]|uniref:TraD/TraG TraM recognition site domain-containing protein n=1 Tax=Rothia nasimurium TaxID=85336 RepID=A0A4Y9F483_9MICC|nr:type IV secretory system conjugative DNA transfer family protein [Rothia nasimurium]MBF0808460.1 type IV secretory system conjugative DNA transfer family protein [Rothia nasimurium]TFU21952.1 hypothetical protein E4U03_07535 [Rothia nasimurium]